MTVAEAMKNLTTTEKLVPLEVTVVPQELTGTGHAAAYHATNMIVWLFRSLVVWTFFFTFLPQLGVTYFMVLFGLWAIRHATPPKLKEIARITAPKR